VSTLPRPPSGVAVLSLVVLSLTGCGSADGSGEAAGGSARESSFVVVGDSITAGTADPIRGPDVDAADSWVLAAIGEPLTFLGGWATPGATTAGMRDGVERYDAHQLVLMAGTNDLGSSVPWDASEDHLVDIVERVGIDRVVLAAVPPLDPLPAQVVEYNRRLELLADREGWIYVDPWTGVSRNGSFTEGASRDGVHPVPAAAEQAGERLREVLLEGAGN
jgi:lysophospholipase L1-like esterase